MSEPLIRRINRDQMLWRAVDVEQLIGEDHPARAIWGLVGRLDLEGFYALIECTEEEGGRPAYDPRLLITAPLEMAFFTASVFEGWGRVSITSPPTGVRSSPAEYLHLVPRSTFSLDTHTGKLTSSMYILWRTERNSI